MPGPKKSEAKSLREYVVIDTETTGLSVTQSRIVEVAALRFRDGKIEDRLVELVKSDIPVEDEARAVHGITDAMLARDGRSPKKVFEDLVRFIGKLPLVAHNGMGFDFPLLRNHFAKHEVEFGDNALLDTLPLSASLLGAPWGRRSLSDLAARFKIDPGRAHRAEADSLTAAAVLSLVLEKESRFDELWKVCGERSLGSLATMPPGFELIGEAMERGLEVSIRYQSDGKPAGDRWILPEVLVLDRGANLSVLAYCPTAKIQKQFRLDRILKIYGEVRKSSRAA